MRKCTPGSRKTSRLGRPPRVRRTNRVQLECTLSPARFPRDFPCRTCPPKFAKQSRTLNPSRRISHTFTQLSPMRPRSLQTRRSRNSVNRFRNSTLPLVQYTPARIVPVPSTVPGAAVLTPNPPISKFTNQTFSQSRRLLSTRRCRLLRYQKQ